MEQKEDVKNIVGFFALVIAMLFIWFGIPTIITVVSIFIGIFIGITLPFIILFVIAVRIAYYFKRFFKKRRRVSSL